MNGIIIFLFVCSSVNGILAKKLNRSVFQWMFVGIIFPFISFFLLWSLPKRNKYAGNDNISNEKVEKNQNIFEGTDALEEDNFIEVGNNLEKEKKETEELFKGEKINEIKSSIEEGDFFKNKPIEIKNNIIKITDIENISKIKINDDERKNKIEERRKMNEKLVSISNRIRKEKEQVREMLRRFYIQGKSKPLFVDVETTGLHGNDKIVSICMILLDTNESNRHQKLIYKSLYYIFDPGKKSHPIAESVHGYNDWVLRHQNLFEEKMSNILSFIEESNLIVAHNVKFDLRFIKDSFANSGIDIGEVDTICTMEMHGGSLSACARKLGIEREKSTHDAAEDAVMCMCLYLSKMRNINILELYNEFNIPKLENFIIPPPMPEGKLPRRNNVKKRLEILGK